MILPPGADVSRREKIADRDDMYADRGAGIVAGRAGKGAAGAAHAPVSRVHQRAACPFGLPAAGDPLAFLPEPPGKRVVERPLGGLAAAFLDKVLAADPGHIG